MPGKYKTSDLQGQYSSSDLTDTPTEVAKTKEIPVGSISAYKPDLSQKLSDWRQQLSEFANRGAGSYKVGNTSDIGDFMASGPMGALRAGKGVVEASKGKVWEGAKDVVGGGMEAGTIPSMMFAPEGAGAAGKLLPSTEKAGKMLDAVEKAAGHVPINLSGPGQAALKIQEMAQSGATMPKVVRDFLNRVTRPGAQPLTYAEARKFYENATRVSFDEMNRLTPKAKYLLGKFTKELDTANHDAARAVGQGDLYAKAMRAYHSAAKFRSFKQTVNKKVLPAAAMGAAGAAGAGAAYKLWKAFE